MEGLSLLEVHEAVTHDDYNVYTAADGSAYFLQDGKWYELATTNGSKRFVKLDVAPDLSGFADRGKFSLYIGTSDKNSSIRSMTAF